LTETPSSTERLSEPERTLNLAILATLAELTARLCDVRLEAGGLLGRRPSGRH